MFLNELGIPVTEHCNLNCKGCLHFCHKGQEPHFYSPDIYHADLKRLSRYIENIDVLRLYGGEPLLHPELKLFIEISKHIFPNTNIELLTNGLLLTSISQELTETLRHTDTIIKWSVYPVMNNVKIQEIYCFLKENYLNFTLEYVYQFYTCCNFDGDSPKEIMFQKCSGKYCHLLRNGKISVCPVPLVGHLIHKFGVNLDLSDSILDIYDEHMTAEKIDMFLHSVHDVCRYCSPPRYFDWEQQNDPDIEDWITKNNDWKCYL